MQTVSDSKNSEEKVIPFAALFSVPVETVDGPKNSQIHCGDDEPPTVTSIAPGQD